MKSKLIAISAVSAGFIALLLTLGSYFEFADVFTVVFASIFVILPLYYKSYKACLLTFLAGGLLAFMLSGFNLLSLVFPAYFGFFGLFPIVRLYMQEKNLKKFIIYIIGLVWCVGIIFGLYFLMLGFMPHLIEGLPLWVENNIYYILAFLGVVIYFLFDLSVVKLRVVTDYYLSKIIK